MGGVGVKRRAMGVGTGSARAGDFAPVKRPAMIFCGSPTGPTWSAPTTACFTGSYRPMRSPPKRHWRWRPAARRGLGRSRDHTGCRSAAMIRLLGKVRAEQWYRIGGSFHTRSDTLPQGSWALFARHCCHCAKKTPVQTIRRRKGQRVHRPGCRTAPVAQACCRRMGVSR